MAHTLHVLPGHYAVVRLPPDAAIPEGLHGELVSITRTAQELSVVAEQASVPADVPAERDWRFLRVQGPLDFDMVGVMADLSGCLAAAGVSIFVISTHDTDYLAVKSSRLDEAIAALRSQGHRVEAPTVP